MALDIFTGDSVPALLVRAREELGPDATVVQIRRRGNTFELLASAASAPAPPVVPTARPDEAIKPLRFDQLLAAGMLAAQAAPTTVPPTAPSVTPRMISPASGPVPKARPIIARPGSKMRPRIIALVGPTGVGKTTTIAKLASHPSVFGRKRVGLIGLDTFRVGAVEQLRTWGELANAEVGIVQNETELRRTISRLIECDVVLIDTPGRGPKQQGDASIIASWLKMLAPDETHLLLSAGQMPQVTRRLMSEFKIFEYSHVVASKLDECPDDTRLFDIVSDVGLPMRWITNGQSVPADLGSAAEQMAAAVRCRSERRRVTAA